MMEILTRLFFRKKEVHMKTSYHLLIDNNNAYLRIFGKKFMKDIGFDANKP